jgi:hypothetical protein
VTRAATQSMTPLLLLALLPLLLGSMCEGDGSGTPPRLNQKAIDERCAPIAGDFPSGFDLLPGAAAFGVAMQFSPPALLTFRLDSVPPQRVRSGALHFLAADSDGDGVDDAAFFRSLGLCPHFNPSCSTYPTPGSVTAIRDDLVLVTSSGYEQVLFLSPFGGAAFPVSVLNPSAQGDHRPEDHPFLPAPGITVSRTAIATQVCVYPDSPASAFDSLGRAIAPEPFCDVSRPGFLTGFSAATAMLGDRLFVATSNLRAPSVARFEPGTVLVFDFVPSGTTYRVSPRAQNGALFTTAFNPTGLTPHRTQAGRDLLLVSLTGAIDAGGTVIGEGGIDVIDVASLRIVAHIPLGLSGTSFGPIAIDPGARIGLAGAEGARQIYAVDLRSLEDPALYSGSGTPIWLDGSQLGFADARIHWADAPLALPHRADGPDPRICPPRTNVALNTAGDLAYVTDWCDGSLVTFDVDTSAASGQPITASAFTLVSRANLVAPKTASQFGRLSTPSMIRTRRGGGPFPVDEPDAYFIANEPDGHLCAIRAAY